MKPQIWRTLLCCLIAAMFLTLGVLAANIVDSGTCGAEEDNLTWTLDSDGVLTISGTGAMHNWDKYKSPWYGKRTVTAVIICDGVTTIGEYAFHDCINLTSAIISDSVVTISSSAFYYCPNLTSVTIPNSVTTIGDWAFYSCRSLTSVTIPDSITEIAEHMFSSCENLTNVTIPNSVTTISDWAFYGCRSLTNVVIPNSVVTIGNGVFDGCSSLVNINVEANHPAYSSATGVLFNKSRTILLIYPASNGQTYIIPDSVITIGDYAFSSCENLISITIPRSVTTIGNYAFSACTNVV